MKPLLEASIIANIAYILRISRKDVLLKIEKIKGYYSKYDLEHKHEIAFSIEFVCNCALPPSIGDFTQVGFGAIVLIDKVSLEDDSIEPKEQTDICQTPQQVIKPVLENKSSNDILLLPENMNIWLANKGNELGYTKEQYIKLLIHTAMEMEKK